MYVVSFIGCIYSNMDSDDIVMFIGRVLCNLVTAVSSIRHCFISSETKPRDNCVRFADVGCTTSDFRGRFLRQ